MQPLTSKELGYIADSLSNEDLMMKQSAHLAGISQHPQVRQVFAQFVQRHQQHHQHLMSELQQHQTIAPSQLQ